MCTYVLLWLASVEYPGCGGAEAENITGSLKSKQKLKYNSATAAANRSGGLYVIKPLLI